MGIKKPQDFSWGLPRDHREHDSCLLSLVRQFSGRIPGWFRRYLRGGFWLGVGTWPMAEVVGASGFKKEIANAGLAVANGCGFFIC